MANAHFIHVNAAGNVAPGFMLAIPGRRRAARFVTPVNKVVHQFPAQVENPDLYISSALERKSIRVSGLKGLG